MALDPRKAGTMIDRIPAIEAQIRNLDQGVTRIEALLKAEIADLKAEQIADLRRDMRGAQDEIIVLRNEIIAINRKLAEYKGGISALHWVSMAIGTGIGIAVSLLTKFWK